MPDHREPFPPHSIDRDDPGDTPLGHAVAAYLAGDLKPLQRLPDDDQDLILAVGPWLAALRDSDPSTAVLSGRALTDPDPDPIAIALGLIPDPDRALSAERLASVRRRTRLKRSDLVGRLVARGWDVSMQDLDEWERSDTAQPPALIAAIADILRTSPMALTVLRASIAPRAWVAALDDDSIAAQLAGWASEAGLDSSVLRAKVEHALAGAYHRGQKTPTVQGLSKVIEVLRQTPDFLDRA